MTRKAIAFTLLVLALAALGCRSSTDRSEGTVLMTVSNFQGVPSSVSATTGPFSITSVTLTNVAKDPTGTTSNLQTIEMRSYEVRFTRRDTGRQVPPTLVGAVFGNIPVGGTLVYNNLPFLTSDQTLNSPILDLARRGVDPETGSAVVVLDASMRFFGRTLAGDDIVSTPASFTIEVTR
jgi:hypothetical protein